MLLEMLSLRQVILELLWLIQMHSAQHILLLAQYKKKSLTNEMTILF